jgi:predicted AlkP superfamily pyrophosphatase or phosphodiesterase
VPQALSDETTMHVKRFAAAVAILIAAVATLRAHAQQTPAAHTHLVIVVDGLRPDYMTPDVMPRLVRLGQRGIVFTAHHSVVPTVTRVNGASLVTGAYPETHGLLGNAIYIPSVNPTRRLDTGSREALESVARAEGRLLTAPTLGEILQRAGRKLLVVGSGTSGAAFVLNHTVAGGAIVHHEFTRPQELEPKVIETLGPPPPHAYPNAAQNRRAVDAYLKIGLDDMRPDLTFMWISDPDTTAHNRGMGSPTTREALARVDAEIGRIEDTLASKGLLDRTNLIVTSDHGFSTHTKELALQAIVDPFVRKLDDGTPDIVVAEGAIHLRTRDAARVAALVAELQRRPEVGAIFTRASGRGSVSGTVQGTLSFEVARWNHARSGDILVSSNWTRSVNDAGFAGTTTDSGVAGHGSSSPYDVHNTLIAAGPGFREHASSDIPTGNVDIAPTLLRLMRLSIPSTMTGRVIDEGLRTAPARAAPRVDHVTRTVKNADGSYELTAHLSAVGSHQYLDYTEVRRHR